MSAEHPHQTDPLSEKQKRWDDILIRLEKTVDSVGEKIDLNARETIAALQVNDIPTSSSCGGHADKERLRFPYVMGEAEGEPEYRCIGQKELVEKVAAKYGIPDRQGMWSNMEAQGEYLDGMRTLVVSDEYRLWKEKNPPLLASLRELVAEFYAQYEGVPESQLIVRPSTGYRMETANYLTHKEMQAMESSEIQEQIRASQEEFEAFTQFLRQRYFRK